MILGVLLSAGACGGRAGPGAAGPAAGGVVGKCFDLPGTARASLRLGPDGKALYWHERVPFYGYSLTWPKEQVGWWGLGDAPPRTMTTFGGAPFRVLADGRIVAVGESGVVVWKDGVVELLSNHDEIDHLEVVGDGGAAVYLAAGALWRQPLHRATAARLGEADALVGVDGERIVLWRGDELIARDGGGREQVLPAPDGELLKTFGEVMVVRRDDGLALQPLRGGAAKVVLAGEWATSFGPDGVRASRVVGDGAALRIEVAIVDGAGVARVPDVVGADGIGGAVRLPDGRVAYLVGFDIDGDGEVTTGDEHDLCIGDGTRPLTVTPRAVPKRWLAAVPALDRIAAQVGAERYAFSSTAELPTLSFIGAPRARERAERWAMVRRAAAAVAGALGDPSFDVVIKYDDGGRALAEWDSASGKRIAWAGVGGALVADPADYEVDVTTDTLARNDDGTVTCAGSITNKTKRELAGLVVDCVGGEDDTPIPVFPSTVPPGHVARFAGSTAAEANGSLVASVHRPESAENFLTYDGQRAARFERIAAAAAEVVDRARLTLWDWTGGPHVRLEVWGPDDFPGYSHAARTMAAEIAYDVLGRVDRAAWLADADARLSLVIRVGDEAWTYDGKELIDGEPE